MRVGHNFTQGRYYMFCKKVDKCKIISLKFMNNITTRNCFVSTFVKKNKITGIILTLQMARVTSSLKVQVEIIFYVNRFNLVPCMAIMFPVHSLHLTRVTIRTNNRGQLKQHLTIKCGRNAGRISIQKLS
jgi:hypothetical protein